MSKYADDIAAIRAGMAVVLERTGTTNKQLEKLNGTVGELDDQVNTNRTDIAKLQERQSVLSVVGTSISTGISSGVAIFTAWVMGR